MDLTHNQAVAFIAILATIIIIACYAEAQVSLTRALILGGAGSAMLWLTGAHYNNGERK